MGKEDEKIFIRVFSFDDGGIYFISGTRPVHISLQSSDYVVYKLMNLLEKVVPSRYDEFYQLANVIVRKGAHLFEYAMLGGLLYSLFKCFKQREHNCWIYALFLVLLCATMDEFFQSFVGANVIGT